MILNLANIEDSDIEYQLNQFPDGQQSVDITGLHIDKTYAKIKSRLRNFGDLEVIISATASLRELGIEKIDLFVPYFLGARSDRKFVDGGSNYIKDVIAPIINIQNYNTVTVLDPHSDVLEACIKNFKSISNQGFVTWAFGNFSNDIYSEDIEIVSPDAGALKKVFKNAKELEHESVIVAQKVRNLSTGEITHTEVPLLDNDRNKFVIIDDICDGGRTFIEIAKVILDKRPKDKYDTKIYLVVTHGIFSKGFKELNKYFDKIYTSDSYVDVNSDYFSLRNDNKLHKVKQLKIF
jgi:ribose-phosphate pyrophosphokinase